MTRGSTMIAAARPWMLAPIDFFGGAAMVVGGSIGAGPDSPIGAVGAPGGIGGSALVGGPQVGAGGAAGGDDGGSGDGGGGGGGGARGGWERMGPVGRGL